MPRWNNSLNDNCLVVINNKIKDIKPDLVSSLIEVVTANDVENKKKSIELFLRNHLAITSAWSKRSKNYWISRGWSANEAYIKAKENKQQNCKSVYSQQTWLERLNPITGVNYTVEEADFERNSRRPIRKEYWIKQGYSENEAVQLAANTKNSNNRIGATSSAITTVRKATSKRCAEYYTSRGYSEDEASVLVSDGQKYFSKDICIKKYGEIEGIKIWQKRQDDWQATLNAKTDEEKARINRLKISKGITVSKAEKIILSNIKTLYPSAEHQFTLFQSDKKQYIYDIQVNNKIIEYNGDFWHSNPLKYLPEFVNPRTKIKAKDKWDADNAKIKFAEDQGYKVLVIWESDFKKDKEKVIQQCIQFLKQ